MATDIDKDLQILLWGEALSVSSKPYIDLPAKGKYIPVLKESVCYIVAAVVTNDHQEVLMMQEAKKSCWGKWYLPAGRVEPNETLEEAVKREVLEETGLEFEPTSLAVVEIQSAIWYRFTFFGKATGGTLKTLEAQDAESLQAKWCVANSITRHNPQLPLRSSDVLSLIHIVLTYHQTEPRNRHPILRPQIVCHKKLLLRLVLVQSHGTDWTVLVGTEGTEHFPVVEMSEHTSLMAAMKQILQKVFGTPHPQPKWHGVLCLEHAGKPANVNDGICVTLLASLEPNHAGTKAPPSVNKAFAWHLLKTQTVVESLTSALQKGNTLPLVMF